MVWPGPKMATGWPKMAASWPKTAPRRFQDRQTSPRWPQDDVKMASGTSKIVLSPKRRQTWVNWPVSSLPFPMPFFPVLSKAPRWPEMVPAWPKMAPGWSQDGPKKVPR